MATVLKGSSIVYSLTIFSRLFFFHLTLCILAKGRYTNQVAQINEKEKKNEQVIVSVFRVQSRVISSRMLGGREKKGKAFCERNVCQTAIKYHNGSYDRVSRGYHKLAYYACFFFRVYRCNNNNTWEGEKGGILFIDDFHKTSFRNYVFLVQSCSSLLHFFLTTSQHLASMVFTLN